MILIPFMLMSFSSIIHSFIHSCLLFHEIGEKGERSNALEAFGMRESSYKFLEDLWGIFFVKTAFHVRYCRRDRGGLFWKCDCDL